MEPNKSKGSLYLIPTTLGPSEFEQVFPEYNRSIILGLNHFIVEDIRSARRFLKSLNYPGNFDEVTFLELNKHTKIEDTFTYLRPLNESINIGLLSEAGMPCLADPGNIIVKMAHESGFKVVPLIGPSSIILALIASGFNGQNFAFAGYLPIKTPDRIRKIKEIESNARKTGQTTIFIEAPYRNRQLLETITGNCNPDTMLCIACDITLETEYIKSQSIESWKKALPDIQKKPTVFLISY